jgi:NTP pyrophosphatase (non-canonical NTP hydrolase)
MGWSDDTTRLTEIRAALRDFNRERDWGRYHNPRNLAMALSVEAAELLELYLWSSDEGPQPALPSRVPKVADEAADVLICLLNLCEHAGIDLAAAVETKLAKNAAKYPIEAASGRMEKYDELAHGSEKARPKN